jgi:hypothetical protein
MPCRCGQDKRVECKFCFSVCMDLCKCVSESVCVPDCVCICVSECVYVSVSVCVCVSRITL